MTDKNLHMKAVGDIAIADPTEGGSEKTAKCASQAAELVANLPPLGFAIVGMGRAGKIHLKVQDATRTSGQPRIEALLLPHSSQPP